MECCNTTIKDIANHRHRLFGIFSKNIVVIDGQVDYGFIPFHINELMSKKK